MIQISIFKLIYQPLISLYFCQLLDTCANIALKLGVRAEWHLLQPNVTNTVIPTRPEPVPGSGSP